MIRLGRLDIRTARSVMLVKSALASNTGLNAKIGLAIAIEIAGGWEIG